MGISVVLLALGAIELFGIFRFLPDCQLDYNIIVSSGCLQPITWFGLDPNVVAGAILLLFGFLILFVGPLLPMLARRRAISTIRVGFFIWLWMIPLAIVLVLLVELPAAMFANAIPGNAALSWLAWGVVLVVIFAVYWYFLGWAARHVLARSK